MPDSLPKYPNTMLGYFDVRALMHRFAPPRAVWRRAAILLTLCAALAAIAASAPLHEALLEVLTALEELIDEHPLAGALLFVVFAAISAMFTFVSIAIVVPAAVFAWGEPASMVLLWAGWVIGGIATYNIGRWLGRPVVRWLAADPALSRFEYRLQRNTPFWVVLVLQLALPSEIPGYILGLANYSFPRYLVALGIAELPYTIATVRLGASFVAGHSGVILAAGLAIALLSIGAFYILHRTTRAMQPEN